MDVLFVLMTFLFQQQVWVLLRSVTVLTELSAGLMDCPSFLCVLMVPNGSGPLPSIVLLVFRRTLGFDLFLWVQVLWVILSVLVQVVNNFHWVRV